MQRRPTLPPKPVLDATAERTAESRDQREATRSGLVARTSPLELDSPDRAGKRLRRLGLDRLGFERIIGRNNLIEVSALERGARVARAVGRVRIRDAAGRLVGTGTGVLVSPELLLTNQHVLRDPEEARYSQIEFNFQDGLDGRPLAPVVFDFDPDRFYLADPVLDFALLAVRDDDRARQPLSAFGWCPLKPEEGKVLKGEFLNIIQHPNGGPKQAAIRENRLTALLELFLHYETDTAPGSSGSPVFNDQWEMVALHHSGVPERDDEGNLVAIGGGVWREELGEHRLSWVANEGARVSRIVRRLLQAELSPTADALRAELLSDEVRSGPPERPGAGVASIVLGPSEADPARVPGIDGENGGPPGGGFGGAGPFPPGPFLPGEPAGRGHSGAGRPRPSDPSAPLLLRDATGLGATWRFPVQVRVQVGDDDGPPAPSYLAPGTTAAWSPPGPSRRPRPGRRSADPGATPRVLGPRPSLDAPLPPALARELEESLEELGRAGERPYYDQTEDEAARAAYYRGLDEDPPTDPGERFDALHRLLTATHRRKLRYRPSRYVYPWVDLQPNGQLRSVYSGKEFEPGVAIREDLAVEAARTIRLQELLAAEADLDPEAAIDLLEARLPYNCEHVVPQSWFGKREPMRGDLHHLFACEWECNSFRGNLPYWDFPEFEEVEREDCGKRVGQTKFEPGRGKGEAARAVLYFLLRYPGDVDDVVEEVEEARLQILLDWHRAHPVTLHERHRNAAIFALQGNRNPLVDAPEQAAEIDFRRGLG